MQAAKWETWRTMIIEGRQHELPAEFVIRYPQAIETILNLELTKVIPMEGVMLNAWQQEVMDICSGPINPREFHWFWEPVGNVGKSFMCNYLRRNHGATSLSNGKTCDIAYLYKPSRIVVWDFSRSTDLEKINYHVMEQLSNGWITSTKYQSMVKNFDPPHQIVFANAPPPHGKLSEDRLKVHRIGEATVMAHGFIPPPVPPPSNWFDELN